MQQRNLLLLLLLRAVTQCVSPSVTLVVYSRFDSVLQCQPVDFLLLLLRLHNQPAVIIITDHFVCEDERASRAEPTAVVSVRVLISFAGELAIDDAITVGYDNDNDSARSTWAAIRDAGQKEKEKKRKAEGPHISRSIHLWLLLLPVRPSQKA